MRSCIWSNASGACWTRLGRRYKRQIENACAGAVYTISLDAVNNTMFPVFYEICKIERYTSGHERRQLERQISGYLSQNRDILRRTRGHALSAGRWQRWFYKAAAVCFGSGLDAAGFVCLRFYAGITKGEVKNVTRDS